jgi:type II secretory pathway pseudopilin PulG
MTGGDAQALVRLLIKVLRGLQAGIDEYTKTIRESQQSGGQQPEQPLPLEIRSELRFPRAIREYYESEQRERQSTWKKIKTGLEIIGVSAAVILAILTYFTFKKVSSQANSAQKQADSAQKQVRIMQKQLEAAERSWIKLVECKPTELYFWRGSAGINIQATIQNVGHSVATNVHVGIMIVLPKWGNGWMEPLPKAQKEICDTMTKSQDDATVFVNDSLTKSIGSSIGISADGVNVIEGSRDIMPLFAGCIDYQDSVSAEHHQTSFIYDVLKQPINGRSSRFFEIPRQFGAEPIHITAIRLDCEERYDSAR